MNTNVVLFIGALAIFSLGIFFMHVYGVARYHNGYDQCVIDTEKSVAETAKRLEVQRNETIPDSNVMLKLRANNWLRSDADK